MPATTLEQPVVTQPVPSPAPAPRPALQAAPALRGSSVPVVAPVGWGAASAVVPAHWRGLLVMQMQDLAEVEAPIGPATPGTSTAAPLVPSFTGGVVLSASTKDGRSSGGSEYQHDRAPRGQWLFLSRLPHASVGLEEG